MQIALAALALAAGGPEQPYATPEAAMRRAARDAVRTAVPGGRLVRTAIDCIGGDAEVGERGTCGGGMIVVRRGRRAEYGLTWRSRVRRTATTTVEAKLDARRYRGARRLPERLAGRATLDGPAPPAERTDHANLVLDRGGPSNQTLSRTTWFAFPVPFWWRQAYGEGPVTLVGFAEHAYDLPPGGVCGVQAGLSARVTADPPVERDGRLIGWSRWGDDEAAILGRSDDGAGTTTWTLDQRRTARAGPAPPGIGPPELDTLVLDTYVEGTVDRYGAPGRDGYPVLAETRAQKRRCEELTDRAAATLVPRALDAARPERRARPPKPDPDDEAPTPVEPER